MKREYDFSKAARGKFYRPGAKIYLPVYLEPENLQCLRQMSEEKGIEVEDIVNEWIKKDISIVKTVK
jgi:hypothetical protein